ncbi:hypothetical protein K2Z83_21660 [Oscillochloris sp. ZM17-4]|uniref:hypothetical protein n=1 Tax=Oscillochloris sp. ZM17-4 TaxID=2866714 RepID=UPI001C732407|nr:hypothetical protein [Oscillochloris sp. ZM17-4]MBX0330277.1 hypothetical protein [Oscillochloris sp. ZM17-4]
MTRPARAAVAAGAALLILLLACALAGFAATGRPGARRWQLDSPAVGGHVYSLWLLPCDALNPGQILFVRDAMIFSRYPPPGLAIPLAPACP